MLFEPTSKDDFKDTISQIQDTGEGNAKSFVIIYSVIDISLMMKLEEIIVPNNWEDLCQDGGKNHLLSKSSSAMTLLK